MIESEYVVLAITGTITGTSKQKLCQELELETMKGKRWFGRLCCFYKILNNQAPAYLNSLLSPPIKHYNTCNYSKIRQIFCRTETFSNSFFLKQLVNGTNLIPQSNSFIFSILQSTFRLYRTDCK